MRSRRAIPALIVAVHCDQERPNFTEVIGPFSTEDEALDWIENGGQPFNPNEWIVTRTETPIWEES
jgi:hypothetical protein